jgi:hypothetical protein
MFNLRALFHKKRAEQEMDAELRFHLEKQTEQNIARGMRPEEARYAALRQFGKVGQIKEECRDPGFTVVSIVHSAVRAQDPTAFQADRVPCGPADRQDLFRGIDETGSRPAR